MRYKHLEQPKQSHLVNFGFRILLLKGRDGTTFATVIWIYERVNKETDS